MSEGPIDPQYRQFYGAYKPVKLAQEIRQTDPLTGGQKGVKPERFELMPGPALSEVARVYAFGAKKYADHNWYKGYNWSWSLGALFRHIYCWASGESRDQESGLHHLAHAVFHCLTLITFEHEAKGTDDRLYGAKTAEQRPG